MQRSGEQRRHMEEGQQGRSSRTSSGSCLGSDSKEVTAFGKPHVFAGTSIDLRLWG